jgi:hypothetical protein
MDMKMKMKMNMNMNMNMKMNMNKNLMLPAVSYVESNSKSLGSISQRALYSSSYFRFPHWHLNLFGLSFRFNHALSDESFEFVDTGLTPNDAVTLSKQFLLELDSVNERGYVNMNRLNESFLKTIREYMVGEGYVKKALGQSKNTYTLWHNLLFLSFFYLLHQKLVEMDEGTSLYLEASCLKSQMFAKLDPFIRFQLQKRGVTIIQNSYVGFDTEFEMENQQKHQNKLVSSQIAVQSRTLIKVPLYTIQDVSYIHPLTNEISGFYQPLDEEWPVDKVEEPPSRVTNWGKKPKPKPYRELKIINNSLKTLVRSVRFSLFAKLDAVNLSIVEKLKTIDGISHYVDKRKDQVVFSLPLSQISTSITYSQYSLKTLLEDVKRINLSHRSKDFKILLSEVVENCLGLDTARLPKWFEGSMKKSRICTRLLLGIDVKITLSLVNNFYICSHFNCSDLPMLADFEAFKPFLSIINKSFVTIRKPIRIYDSTVYIRDTILLSPAGMNSLDKLGSLYLSDGELGKIKISTTQKEKMSEFLLHDKDAFEEYAIRDAVICLKHSTAMESFNFSLKQLGVPLTLSSIGRNYVFDSWRSIFPNYFPYQMSGKVSMGNPDEVQTPKGLFETGDTGLHLSYFIGNYKGGRNESFMYGSENQKDWFDYDLVSAYTTAMADLALPAYALGHLIQPDKVHELGSEEFLRSYIIINGTFQFPTNTKYPSIPCYIDETTTVYPLAGNCLLTGPEYILAQLQGCKIEVKSAFVVPPSEDVVDVDGQEKLVKVQPFHDIIKEIQRLRTENPKGTIMNLLYKEMGNSIYGNVVRGMSNKKHFDSLTGEYVKMSATDLSNPILASWTTAFIRSVIGECLHNIALLKGKVVSVTTDGFITDLPNLEEMLLNLPVESRPLFTKYRELREDLSGDPKSIELKHEGRGVISWSTRGQLGIGSLIKATTGFQSTGYDHSDLVTFFNEVLRSDNKQFEYVAKRLRGAKDIFTKGGHVQSIYKDQKFRLLHDNRRMILEPSDFNSYDLSSTLLDSSALSAGHQALRMRCVGKFPYTLTFNKQNTPATKNTYRSYLEVGVRNFIKGYVSNQPVFGLLGTEFKSSTDLINFISEFDSTLVNKVCCKTKIKVTRQSIWNLKNRKLFWRPVPHTKENVAFSSYVKTRLPHFIESEFIKAVS